jgi:hypothetical protein
LKSFVDEIFKVLRSRSTFCSGPGIRRRVAEKPSETRDKPHFQRHNCPGPDFWSENGKKGIFIWNPLLEMTFLPFFDIFSTPSPFF